jgi:hypothetical protein
MTGVRILAVGSQDYFCTWAQPGPIFHQRKEGRNSRPGKKEKDRRPTEGLPRKQPPVCCMLVSVILDKPCTMPGGKVSWTETPPPPSPSFGAALLPTCHPRAGPSSAHLSAVAVLSQSPHWTLDSGSGWIEFWRMKHHLGRKRGLSTSTRNAPSWADDSAPHLLLP